MQELVIDPSPERCANPKTLEQSARIETSLLDASLPRLEASSFLNCHEACPFPPDRVQFLCLRGTVWQAKAFDVAQQRGRLIEKFKHKLQLT
jgi:hypothetical protein